MACLLLFLPRLPLGRVGCTILSASFVGASSVSIVLATHCACFGEHHVSPGDRLLIALLLFTGVMLSNSLVFQRRMWLPVGCAAIGAFLIGALAESSPLNQWVERELSAAAFRRVLPPELHEGTWRVTAIRADCPSCVEYLGRQALMWNRKNRANARSGRVLLVLGRHRRWIDRYSAMFARRFSIPDSPDLLMTTPVQFEVSSGRVTSERLIVRGGTGNHGI